MFLSLPSNRTDVQVDETDTSTCILAINLDREILVIKQILTENIAM